MTTTYLNLSQSGMADQIQANMLAYMRLFAGLPGVQMRDDACFWLVSHRPAPGNAILRARFSVETVEKDMDELFAQIGGQLSAVDWMVFPGDTPADLNQRLKARGMPGSRGGNWLWADLSAAVGQTGDPPKGFHVERVRDDQGLAEWVRLSEAGFGGALSLFYDAYARHGYGPEARSLHYTGYLGDRPVTSGTLLDAGGSASIYDVSTPPEFRRQGLGGALTRHLLAEIRARGYASTWIWSSDSAQALYRECGYVDADFGQREHSWKKT